MDVSTIIARVIAPATNKPASAAYALNRKELATRGAEAEVLAKKIAELSGPINAAASDERELEALQDERRSLRADVLTGDARDGDLTAIDARIAAVRERSAKRGDKADIAGIARTRLMAKLSGLQAAMLALQQQAPRLYQAVLVERMDDHAGAYFVAQAAFLDAFADLAAMAHAHDQLCPLAPGSTAMRSGFMDELVIPLPSHSSFAQTADHNLRAEIVSRANEILADVPQITV